MFRPRRPLLRAAMVGGAGYMAGKSAARRGAAEADQNERLAELESQQYAAAAPPPPPPPVAAAAPPPPPAPAAPAAGGDDLVSKIQQLKALQDQGVLTAEEFEAAKAKLLAG
jgi:Short C-terminal domain